VEQNIAAVDLNLTPVEFFELEAVLNSFVT
jgi:hypothetical protein